MLINDKGKFQEALETFESVLNKIPEFNMDYNTEKGTLAADLELLKNWARKEKDKENLDRIINLEKELAKISMNSKT